MTSRLQSKSTLKILNVAALTAITLIALPFVHKGYEAHHFQNQLTKHLVKNENETLIQNVTNFDWDVVCHLAANTENWQGNGHVGDFPIKKGVRVPHFTKHGQWGLAFVKDGHTIKAFEVKIPHDVHAKDFCLNGSTAIFKKTATIDGDVYHFTERTEEKQYSHVVDKN